MIAESLDVLEDIAAFNAIDGFDDELTDFCSVLDMRMHEDNDLEQQQQCLNGSENQKSTTPCSLQYQKLSSKLKCKTTIECFQESITYSWHAFWQCQSGQMCALEMSIKQTVERVACSIRLSVLLQMAA
eukprot:4640166-Ditylum_brightwellii.AAC.1